MHLIALIAGGDATVSVPAKFQSNQPDQPGEPDQVVAGRDHVGRDQYNYNYYYADKAASSITERARQLAREAQAHERFEEELLARAVGEYAQRLRDEMSAPPSAPPSAQGNPYKGLLHYQLRDASRFFGRQAAIRKLIEMTTCADSRCRLAVLHGPAGVGKTSLLRAGMAPVLLQAQHLPLVIQAATEPLADAVKRALPLSLQHAPELREAPLSHFLERVADILTPGDASQPESQVFVLVDNFEDFAGRLADPRQSFVDDLLRAMSDDRWRQRWILTMRSSTFYQLPKLQLLPRDLMLACQANALSLAALTRQEAREVVVQSAGVVGIEVEADMADELLHDLDSEAFPDAIAPAELQLVCSELAEGITRGQKLTLQHYRDKGEAERILQSHFDRLLEQQLPDDQELALRLLEVLLERPRHTASEKELKAELEAYGFDPAEVTRVLGVLESSGITTRRDPGAHYDLVSGSLAPRIRQWAAGRATRHAREEAIRQVRYIQGSAFRGLFGGALGLGLAFLLTAMLQSTTPGTLALRTLLRMMPGALCGMVLVLLVDVVLASYRRMRPWARWLTCGLAGAVSFGLALAFHDLIRSAAGAPSRLLLVALEGALWGAGCGAGMLWVMTTRRPVWQPLAVVSLACGVVLALAETFGGAFSTPVPLVGAPNIPASPVLVALAGAVMPLFTIGTALFGHRPSFMRD